MAITYLNSQGTQVYILDATQAATLTGTPATDVPLIIDGTGTSSYLVGCPQSISSIEETRTVTEYKCMSSNDSVKALGAISRGNIELGLLFDPEDVLGQDILKEAFNAATPPTIGIGIELPDNAGVSGTIFYFEGGVSAISVGIEQDAAVTYTVTIEISSEVTEYEAIAA